MYRMPSHRSRGKKKNMKIDLVPIMDSVFIFIFFMLMSANFVKVFEISSEVPLISNQEPPPDKKPLALTLEVSEKEMKIFAGVPAQLLKTIPNIESGFDLETLHNEILKIKKEHPLENQVVLTPLFDASYEEIVKIMDSLRMPRPTDESIYVKGTDGLEAPVKLLFDQILFGNTAE